MSATMSVLSDLHASSVSILSSLLGDDPAVRAILSDGSATVAVADRRSDRSAPDVRVRSAQSITVQRAIRAIEHRRLGSAAYRAEYPEGITAALVREAWGYDDPNAIARGELRSAYLATL